MATATSTKSPAELLEALFDAERTVRRLHDELVASDRANVWEAIETAMRRVRSAGEEDEAALRLVRLANLLGEFSGDKTVDLLIDILASELPEVRRAAGESLSELAFDRFKEVALGIERALTRLPVGSPALTELPFIVSEIPEPGILKLFEKFFKHADTEAVAAAIEASVELGAPELAKSLGELHQDTREVELEGENGELEKMTLGELAMEAVSLLTMGEEDS